MRHNRTRRLAGRRTERPGRMQLNGRSESLQALSWRTGAKSRAACVCAWLTAGAAVSCATTAPKPGDTGSEQTTAACGNDVIDPGEECDGSSMGTGTCASETNGARPNGALICSGQCAYDSSECTASGAGGATGNTGSAPGGGAAGGGSNPGGGAPGAGGAHGAGGLVIPTVGEATLPALPMDCPQIKTGNLTVLGQTVQVWAGVKQPDKRGAVMFYWHGTGGSSGEATLLGPALDE